MGSLTLDIARPELRVWFDTIRPPINDYIAQFLRSDIADPRLMEAMRYAALSPGKRIRPAICVAACQALGGDIADCLPAAAAVELVHAYSLVHDDLPAMDDDQERRGKPTVHVQFGEATAILVGDALLTAAFAALAQLGKHTKAAVTTLAKRAGHDYLLSGQARDLAMVDTPVQNLTEIEQTHRGKTGALFACAAELGAISASANQQDCTALANYGMAIGVAFQHTDDRDDGEFRSFSETTQTRIQSLCREAQETVSHLGRPGTLLRQIAHWIQSAS